jgi:hypothetical protein
MYNDVGGSLEHSRGLVDTNTKKRYFEIRAQGTED